MVFQGRIWGNSVVVLSYGFPGEDFGEGIVCCSCVLWFSKGGFGGDSVSCLMIFQGRIFGGREE